MRIVLYGIGKIYFDLVGGPTKLFENIYDKCSVCDNVDFSVNTVWAKNVMGNFVCFDSGSNERKVF